MHLRAALFRALTVEPELFVCGRPEYTRVVNADGTTRFYEQIVS
ncbi:hypothetical protein [Archangium violaceum]